MNRRDNSSHSLELEQLPGGSWQEQCQVKSSECRVKILLVHQYVWQGIQRVSDMQVVLLAKLSVKILSLKRTCSGGCGGATCGVRVHNIRGDDGSDGFLFSALWLLSCQLAVHQEDPSV